MADATYEAEVVIAGAGLAGLATAYELLGQGKDVLILDKDTQANFGGLAKQSFGGVTMFDTPYQRRQRIQDSPELAWRDWKSFACWDEDDNVDVWPKKWAKLYCEKSVSYIYEFLHGNRVRFLPVMNWPERGNERPGNTLPRWHIAWGTGHEIATRTIEALEAHPNRNKLRVLFEHEVSDVELTGGRAAGVSGRRMDDGSPFVARAERVVIASGGICGGDLSRVRETWYAPWGKPPDVILNGAHDYADGMLHDRVAAYGGQITHLDKHWHYAAGVHNPKKRRPNDGLSLVPPRSALWMNARGERIGPRPLVGYTDTRYLVESICQEPGQYSWQVMNWKIAATELAVSGSEHMRAFREKRKWLLLKNVLFGNHELIEQLTSDIPEDFVVANDLDELIVGMNERSLGDHRIDADRMRADIEYYDAQIARGKAYFNDEQLRRIMNSRTYRGDRIRTCKFQRILDPKAKPLIAIREFILARKSMGGIQTDLSCRVLKPDGETIPGLYAVGEAAGFGGGGIHGHGSLEGTFLGSCVLTGRVAGEAIGRGD